jgi:hypothetical protein
MNQLRPGLWHWTAPHPEWNTQQRWPRDVSSYAIDDGQQLLLFDPNAVPDEVLRSVDGRELVVVLTAPWHERDAQRLVTDHGARVYTPPPDTAQDLMDKFDVTAEQAGNGSDDLRWLVAGGSAGWQPIEAGDRLPIGVEVFAGREQNDLMLWVPRLAALFAGDSFVDFGNGYEVNQRPRGGSTREQIIEILRPLLALPIALVLPAHGAPTDRGALERALA